MDDEKTIVGPGGIRRSTDEVQAATQVAKVAVGESTDEVPHRSFIIEVEPSGDPPRKPVSELSLTRDDLET